MKKLLNTENIVPAALLAFVGWLGVNAVGSNEAIASLQSSQQENQRVNEIVYGFNKVLPSIDQQLKTINQEIKSSKKLINDVVEEQKDLKVTVNCMSAYPVVSLNDRQGMDNRENCNNQLKGGK